jgi:hypothetical protein
MDEVSSKLLVIFQNVNEWLRFAEAKNGILLAFSGAGVTATVTVLATAENIPRSLLIGLLITTSLFCVCALVCSLSFLPKTNLERLLWLQSRPKNSNILVKDTDNLYFYGDLQKYDPTKLLNALNQHYFENKINTP